jgi:hypothetical protein
MNDIEDTQAPGELQNATPDASENDPEIFTFPEGAITVLENGIPRLATPDEEAEILARQQPAPPVKLPNISKLAFLELLVAALGEHRALALLQPTTRFGLIFLAASQVDYDDLFIGIDGDPEQACYTAQLLAAEVVTQAEIEALEESWPTT